MTTAIMDDSIYLFLANPPHNATNSNCTIFIDKGGRLLCQEKALSQKARKMTQFHPLHDTEYQPFDLLMEGNYIGEFRIYYPHRMRRYYEIHLTKDAKEYVSVQEYVREE